MKQSKTDTFEKASIDAYKNLVQATPLAIFTLDLNGHVKSWNPSTERIFGWTQEECLNRPLPIIPPNQEKEFKIFFQKIRQGQTLHSVEVERQKKDGTKLQVTLSAAPLKDAQDNVIGYMGVIEDIARYKQAERALWEAQELKRSNAALEEFAYVASHDLHEPLRKIQSFSERLIKQHPNELGSETHDLVNRIQNATERMQKLIDDLLYYAQTSIEQPKWEQVDLSQVVKNVINDLEIQILQTRGHIEVGNLPTLMANPLHMHQLFQNLIGNGLKFHRPNVPPVVKIYAGPEKNGIVQIHVEDNGIGFSQADGKRIFRIFQRLHGRYQYEGAGLGLAICRKIVEHQKGFITTHSEPNKGAKFIVHLPKYQETYRP